MAVNVLIYWQRNSRTLPIPFALDRRSVRDTLAAREPLAQHSRTPANFQAGTPSLRTQAADAQVRHSGRPSERLLPAMLSANYRDLWLGAYTGDRRVPPRAFEPEVARQFSPAIRCTSAQSFCGARSTRKDAVTSPATQPPVCRPFDSC